MTLGKAVFGRKKGAKSFFRKKLGGRRLFFNQKKGGEDFFLRKNKGAKTFFRLKKGGEDFFSGKFFSKTRPRYPVNFDRSLISFADLLSDLIAIDSCIL